MNIVHQLSNTSNKSILLTLRSFENYWVW